MTASSARLALVFDEAHNLFSGGRRVANAPQRALWIRRLIDGSVPVSFVALPEFRSRIARYVQQLDWDAAQITDLIAREHCLPAELQPEDMDLLVARLAADFSAASKTLISAAAKAQRVAQYVADVVRVARHKAAKDGREVPSEAEVAEAVGARPQFHLVQAAPEAPSRSGATSRKPDRHGYLHAR